MIPAGESGAGRIGSRPPRPSAGRLRSFLLLPQESRPSAARPFSSRDIDAVRQVFTLLRKEYTLRTKVRPVNQAVGCSGQVAVQLTTWDWTTWIARRRSPPDSGIRFWTGRISKRDRLRRDIFQSVIIEREVPRKALASCPVPAKNTDTDDPAGVSAAASWTLLRRSNQPLPACGPAPQTTPNGPEATLVLYGYRVNGNSHAACTLQPERSE